MIPSRFPEFEPSMIRVAGASTRNASSMDHMSGYGGRGCVQLRITTAESSEALLREEPNVSNRCIHGRQSPAPWITAGTSSPVHAFTHMRSAPTAGPMFGVNVGWIWEVIEAAPVAIARSSPGQGTNGIEVPSVSDHTKDSIINWSREPQQRSMVPTSLTSRSKYDKLAGPWPNEQ